MPTPAIPAGTAAPAPAAVVLPRHAVLDLDGLHVNVDARSATRAGQYVHLALAPFDGDPCSNLSPAQARQLAVYLVDCANALDNPAARVIADEPERGAWTCYRCGFRGFWSGGPHDCEAERSLIQRQVDEAGDRCPECHHDDGHYDGCNSNFIPSAPEKSHE